MLFTDEKPSGRTRFVTTLFQTNLVVAISLSACFAHELLVTTLPDHVSKSLQVSIPALPVSTVSRPLPLSANESFGQAALHNFTLVILVIALNTFNIFSTWIAD